jgi:hypothetical protein
VPATVIYRGSGACPQRGQILPTLFRFLAVIGVLAGLGFGAMLALATLVQPEQREMTAPVPPSRFNR